MLNKRELEAAIAECENLPPTYQTCEKLATFYTIYDHLYKTEPIVESKTDDRIGNYGESEFLLAVSGKKSADVWEIIDEAMTAIQVTNPALYNGIMRRL